MSSILIRGGLLVTMNARRQVMYGDLYIEDGRIAAVGAEAPPAADTILDAAGQVVMPGLVQLHVHLTQTLFRGQADDLELLDWLRERIWPLEAAHDEEISALLGCAELIQGGTTCLVDMGTVRHQEQVFQAVAASGLRAFAGKCMMDRGDEVPPGLREDPERSLRESVDLMERWAGAGGGRIRYCLAPRFAISCSEGLLREVARLSRDRGVLVHTHASENRSECALVRTERGMDNVDLKLASGIAPVAEMRRRGIEVGIGADGAPCNNNLDGFLWPPPDAGPPPAHPGRGGDLGGGGGADPAGPQAGWAGMKSGPDPGASRSP